MTWILSHLLPRAVFFFLSLSILLMQSVLNTTQCLIYCEQILSTEESSFGLELRGLQLSVLANVFRLRCVDVCACLAVHEPLCMFFLHGRLWVAALGS